MAKFVPQAELPLVDQVRVRHEKLQALQQEGRDPFQITKFDVTHHAQEIKDRFEELEEQSVRLAGRIMSKRGMGKAIFADLQDRSGRVQIYIKVDEMGEEPFAECRRLDVGDIVGVEGPVFRTQRGEISVRTRSVPALQVPAALAGEVPRPDRRGDPLPPALRGPDRESGGPPQF